MYLHWNQVQKAELVCPTGSLALKDVWCEARSFAPRFLSLSEGSFVPLKALTCESENILRISLGSAELRGMPKVLPTPEVSSEDDTVMVNYTSLIQANNPGALNGSPGWLSATEICAAKVESSTGLLGVVKDLVFDTTTWALKYMVCHDSKVSARQILIDPEWVEQIDMSSKTFQVGLSREILVLEAVFDPRRVGNSKYEIDV